MARYPDAKYQPRRGYNPLTPIRARWRRSCPICHTAMHPTKAIDPPAGSRLRTRAHVIRIRTHPELWVWACVRCNGEQGSLTMPEWLEVLRGGVVHDMHARSRFLHLGQLLYAIREALPVNAHGRKLLDPPLL